MRVFRVVDSSNTREHALSQNQVSVSVPRALCCLRHFLEHNRCQPGQQRTQFPNCKTGELWLLNVG